MYDLWLPWVHKLTSLTGSILTQQDWEIPLRSMTRERVIVQRAAVCPSGCRVNYQCIWTFQDGHCEISSLEVKISYIVILKRERARLHFMIIYLSGAVAQKLLPAVKVKCPASIAGHSLLLLTSQFLFTSHHCSIVLKPFFINLVSHCFYSCIDLKNNLYLFYF